LVILKSLEFSRHSVRSSQFALWQISTLDLEDCGCWDDLKKGKVETKVNGIFNKLSAPLRQKELFRFDVTFLSITSPRASA